ncbi:MAG: hypothetical protein RQ760_09215 [Sedimentisphaerales bacterium]|nr:hypothetical protein [Sedimentisphaerales bacterium]
MEERRYQFTYRFIETNTFKKKHGKMSKSVRDDLDFYLMLGRGELIKETGGLREIKIKDPSGKESWNVVFAAYYCPKIRARIYYLLLKYPPNVLESLDQEEKNKLRMLKEKVDKYIGFNYG